MAHGQPSHESRKTDAHLNLVKIDAPIPCRGVQRVRPRGVQEVELHRMPTPVRLFHTKPQRSELRVNY